QVIEAPRPRERARDASRPGPIAHAARQLDPVRRAEARVGELAEAVAGDEPATIDVVRRAGDAIAAIFVERAAQDHVGRALRVQRIARDLHELARRAAVRTRGERDLEVTRETDRQPAARLG